MIRPTETSLRSSDGPGGDSSASTPASEELDRLAGGVAHDFGNLLTAILGFGELLTDRLPPGTEEHADAAAVVRAALRGRTITAQLSALARADRWRPRRLALDELVRSVAPRLRTATGRGPAPRLLLHPDTGSVEVDAEALEAVLLGLIASAGDVAQGEEAIEIRTRPLDLEAPRPGTAAVAAGAWETVSVVGLPATGDGRGPALAVADTLIGRLGGVLALDDDAAVTVLLPRALDTAAPETEATGRAALADRPSLGAARGSILLVDDQAHVREVLARHLENEGLRVHQARHGRDALAVLEGLSSPPDLVVTDVIMPEMGGRELARELARRSPDLPVLFMSGFAGADIPDDDELPPIPLQDLLIKPFRANELLDRVARRLATRRDE